jgi:hypothetical protein
VLGIGTTPTDLKRRTLLLHTWELDDVTRKSVHVFTFSLFLTGEWP